MSQPTPPPGSLGPPSTPPGLRRALVAGGVVAAVLAAVLLVPRGGEEPDPTAGPAPTGPTTGTPGTTAPASPEPTSESPSPTPEAPSPTPAPGPTSYDRVVVVTLDGTGSQYVTPDTTPALWGLLQDGAGTLNARTETELTLTLPNHTSMVTGRPIIGALGGHGVTWNSDDPRSVLPGVESVFTSIAAAGGQSIAIAGKSKFEMWGRAWPAAVAPQLFDTQDAVVRAGVQAIRADDAALVFVHLPDNDSAGHADDWGSASYLDAVADTDADLARLARAARRIGAALVVTADHGGPRGQDQHGAAGDPQNYTIPFVVAGPGIPAGDLYALSPTRVDPGTAQPAYPDAAPVRNGDVANLVLDLLGLPPVPDSRLDADQDLLPGAAPAG
ncbi:alkaline phosphatase family protein [Nocardioides sp.]|uniref:alkaline phosphatase family protein n=1 Tax=Nocardioides sp. TaxID=35761 RepID=UPI003515667F